MSGWVRVCEMDAEDKEIVQRAIEKERERCARIAGSQIDPESDDWTSGWNAAGESIAKLIRGQK